MCNTRGDIHPYLSPPVLWPILQQSCIIASIVAPLYFWPTVVCSGMCCGVYCSACRQLRPGLDPSRYPALKPSKRKPLPRPQNTSPNPAFKTVAPIPPSKHQPLPRPQNASPTLAFKTLALIPPTVMSYLDPCTLQCRAQVKGCYNAGRNTARCSNTVL